MSLSINPAAMASDRSASVAGVRINLTSLSLAISALLRDAEAGQGFTLFTLNLDHVVKLRRGAAFREAYERATYVTADGWPIVWLAHRAAPRLHRAAGADLVEPLCEVAARHAIALYFIGPGEASRHAAIAILRQRYPGLQIAGAESPAVSTGGNTPEASVLAERIVKSGARICLVSLGAPKQELLAAELSARCPAVGFICVGAALDFISGQTRRAPHWMRRSGLEWFWRLACEPRRLAKRYGNCAYVFALLALGVETVRVESPS